MKLFNTRVIAFETSDYRIKLAKELGADVVINPMKQDPQEAVDEFTKGIGVDVAIDLSLIHI